MPYACGTCGQLVAGGAKVCPHCGRRSPTVPNALHATVQLMFLGFWGLLLVLLLFVVLKAIF